MKGSHNSLSFARPRKWWAWLVVPFWRCQTKDLGRQIAAGVRAFDIRFVWDGHGWHSAHGAVDLDISPLAAIATLERQCQGACVRCILEKGNAGAQLEFIKLCRDLPELFPGLTFFEGIYKPEWKRIHDFGNDEAHAIERTERQYYGSHFAWWKGAVPRLWWLIHRHDSLPEQDTPNHPIIFTDFV